MPRPVGLLVNAKQTNITLVGMRQNFRHLTHAHQKLTKHTNAMSDT